MSRTVSRRRPSSSPRGDTQAICSYCGVRWLRSQLRMDRAGKLACPDERGRDVVTLTEGNAALGERRPPVEPPPGSGSYTPGDNVPLVYARTAKDAGL